MAATAFRVRCIQPLCHLSRRQNGQLPAPRSGRVLGEDGGPDKARAARIPYPGQKEKGTTTMEHLTIDANGAAFHGGRTGAGPPFLLLHGWPEFWFTW